MINQAFSKIWIMVILIILAVGGIFAWQYFNVPEEEVGDETANWQTYRNEEYGFEIKYPDSGDWQTEISTVAGDPAGDPVVIIKNPESHSYFTITKRKNDNNLTLKEWLDDLATSTGQNFENWEKTLIGGIEAYRNPSSEYISIVIANQQKEVFTLFAFGPLPEDDLILEEMLSTFRFLEAEEPYVKVVSPNGGEKLRLGKEYTIRWESESLPSNTKVLIRIKRDDGGIIGIVNSVSPQQVEYQWQIDSTKLLCWSWGASCAEQSLNEVLEHEFKIEVVAYWPNPEDSRYNITVTDGSNSYFNVEK